MKKEKLQWTPQKYKKIKIKKRERDYYKQPYANKRTT